MRKNGVIYYLHSDHLGGTALVTKSDGSVESEQGYWAYGRHRVGGTLPTDYKFTGQKLDATGLMYFNARYYDPELGIFISPDSMVPDTTNLFDYNRYMYSRGNPMKYSDPTGHFVWATAAIGAVIGGAVTGATYMLTTDYADWKGSDIATVVGAGAIARGLIGSGIGAAAGTLQMSAAMAMASSAAVASGSGALATAEASLLTNYAYGQELDKSDFAVSTAQPQPKRPQTHLYLVVGWRLAPRGLGFRRHLALATLGTQLLQRHRG